MPMAGANTEGNTDPAPLAGAGAGDDAWALAATAKLDMTARTTTAEFTMVLDAIVLIGVRSCIATTREVSDRFAPNSTSQANEVKLKNIYDRFEENSHASRQ